jgi:hypothetical protein
MYIKEKLNLEMICEIVTISIETISILSTPIRVVIVIMLENTHSQSCDV